MGSRGPRHRVAAEPGLYPVKVPRISRAEAEAIFGAPFPGDARTGLWHQIVDILLRLGYRCHDAAMPPANATRDGYEARRRKLRAELRRCGRALEALRADDAFLDALDGNAWLAHESGAPAARPGSRPARLGIDPALGPNPFDALATAEAALLHLAHIVTIAEARPVAVMSPAEARKQAVVALRYAITQSRLPVTLTDRRRGQPASFDALTPFERLIQKLGIWPDPASPAALAEAIRRACT